jgi:hypothetical protein
VSPQSSLWAVLGDPDEFGSNWWDKAPLHCGAPPGFDAATVVSLHELDRLISSRHTDVRLLDDGAYVNEEVHRERGLRRSDERTWLSDPATVLARFRAGATIVLRSAHELWPPIEALTSQLAQILDTQVGAMVFVSPSASITDWHADKGHLFVLHLYGAKHWFAQRDGPDGHRQGQAPLAVTLRPGEVLYLPKGFLHRVHGTETVAVHVSFFSDGATWADLLKSALASRIDELSNPCLERNPVNPHWGQASRAEWVGTIDRLMSELQHVMCTVRQALPTLDADSLAPTRPRRPLDRVSQEGAFVNACNAFDVTLGSTLRVRPDINVDVDAGPSMLTLRFDGRVVQLQRSLSDAVARILATPDHTFLPTELGLSDDESLFLIRHLVAEGMLERA